MKTTIFYVLILAIFIACVQANCGNKPRPQDCNAEPRRIGVGGGNCNQNSGQRFSYIRNQNACANFQYAGCVGSNNRFCTQQECEQKCVRRS